MSVALLQACVADADENASASDAELSAPDPNAVRVCSWNIRRLGHQFEGLPKDMPVTASIIRDNCDLIAVQEVMQRVGDEIPGYDELAKTLGDTWSSTVTERPRPDSTSPNSERYAFFFRKSSAETCDGWKGIKYIPDAEDAFLREPAWTCFKLAGRERELILIDYHAIYGSVVERRREVGWLDDDLDNDGKGDDIFRLVRDSRQGKADVVMVGDFNLTPNQLADALPRYLDRTSGSGSTINANNQVTSNLFDHVLVDPEEPIASELPVAEVLDVRDVSRSDTFFHVVSDHLPIRFSLKKTLH